MTDEERLREAAASDKLRGDVARLQERGERCAACGRPTYAGEDFGGPCVEDSDVACALRQRDEAVKERDSAKLACHSQWHDLERIASLCLRTADEYPLKAVERTARERDELRAEVARLRGQSPLLDADPRPLTPEAFIASCQRCRPTKHMHGWGARELGAMVEALVRERDEARAHAYAAERDARADYTAERERERANEWLAQLHDARAEVERFRDGCERASLVGIAMRGEIDDLRAEIADAYRHGGPVTDDVLALADALGLREGKHTTSSVAQHALAEIKRLRAAKEEK